MSNKKYKTSKIYYEHLEMKWEDLDKDLQLGQMTFGFDTQTTFLYTARFLLEKASIADIHIFIICLSNFFELFFKYKLLLIDKKLIWQNQNKFNQQKHNNADFKSITASEALDEMMDRNIVSQDEYDVLSSLFKLRNEFEHFGNCEVSEDKSKYRFVRTDPAFFEKLIKLMKKLLKENENILANNPCYTYSIKPLLKE